MRSFRPLVPALLVASMAACSGGQSALDPAGAEADRLASLFWVMLGVAAVVWLCVLGTTVYAVRVRPDRHDPVVARRFIHWGGIALPTALLAALLCYGLYLMPQFRAPGGPLRVEVSGEQWWWRVRYQSRDAADAVVTANEIRLPVGARVELTLTSADVIHSFWIPSLAGKMDMIPGRANRLVVEPTRTGTFRGVCAEYCGTSHALMAFAVVVMESHEFETWLRREAAPALAPASAQAKRGETLFSQVGCGGCHAVRGTGAEGAIGPDLTHVAARKTLGAGLLPNGSKTLRRWIADAEALKPGSRMPSFGMLPAEDLDAIAAYLEGLE